MYATTNTIAITACLLGALVLFNTSDSASLLITGSDDTSVPQPLDLVTQADTAADTHKKWDIAPDTEVSMLPMLRKQKRSLCFPLRGAANASDGRGAKETNLLLSGTRLFTETQKTFVLSHILLYPTREKRLKCLDT